MNNVLKHLKADVGQVWFGVSGELKKNWFNYAIEWYTKSDYSHALAMYWSEDAQHFVVTNSHGTGVQLDTMGQFFQGSRFKRLFEVKVDTVQRLKFINEAVRLDGTPYSVNNIYGMALAKIFHARVNPFADRDKGIFCSEYTCKLSRAAEIPPACDVMNVGPELVTPKHMVDSFTFLSMANERVTEIILPKN